MPKFKKDISSQTKLPLLVGVVMGPKGSGKSAIVKALHKSDLSGWTKPDPTHFYLVTPKRRAKIQLWYVNLSLNETGKALAWLHANSAQLVFLVLDVERLKSDKVRELEQYREFFLNLSLKNKPTILVINKMDLLKSDAERAILCEKAHQLAEELSVEDTIFCSALPERGSAIREVAFKKYSIA
jgi:GTPase Era involved in 16S rRNA processing